MRKNALVTIAVGELYEQITKHTHPTLQKYANKIDADFIVIKESTCSSPHWEKFQIYNLLNKYERILFVDSDILIREDAPNLFNIVPKDKLGAFNEAPFTQNRESSLIECCKEYGITLPSWNGKYYNTGVLVVSRIHKHLFKKPEKEIFNFYEQGYLNVIFHKSETTMFDLDYKFNRMSCMDSVTGEERFASYFIHYAGFPNLNMVSSLISEDAAKLKRDYPNYNYQRHILIDVQGGLGDQVDAEPAIRFMKEKVYPNEDITIKTHFPRLFEHLHLPTYLHQDFKRKADTPYYHLITLPGPNTFMWSIVSNLLCHTVDFCSMALLRRTLPFEDRKIKLQIKGGELQEISSIFGTQRLNEIILVHAGKHWESKTFPKTWWQGLIDDLHRNGLKVCLIGQDDDTRGVWDLDVRHGMIDARNLLSLGNLIALISQAKLLISNDSSPIHIAGAFDNNIILMPSCKHPDHILPYRNTGKQTALYKKLTLDDCETAPTCVNGSSGEFIKDKWENYLPNIEDVVKTAKEYMK